MYIVVEIAKEKTSYYMKAVYTGEFADCMHFMENKSEPLVIIQSCAVVNEAAKALSFPDAPVVIVNSLKKKKK